jgi:glutathionyl-hydroquinone reductase
MTTRDVSLQSDIAKSFTNQPKDTNGSFNRRPSSFRDTIAKGSKYEPEKGTSAPNFRFRSFPSQPPMRRD